MTVNIRCGMSYLTYVADTNHNRETETQAIEAARADTDATREEAATSNALSAALKKKFEDFQKQVFAMIQTGPSTALSSAHPIIHHDHNDASDEQSVDKDENV